VESGIRGIREEGRHRRGYVDDIVLFFFVPYSFLSPQSPDHFEQYQQDEETSDPWNNTSPRALGATKQSHDPLSSIADLYPGSLPHLRRATALTSTSSHLWDSKTTEEWKAGGDDLVRRFGELMGRITGIVAYVPLPSLSTSRSLTSRIDVRREGQRSLRKR
jgi:hypothetical protein